MGKAGLGGREKPPASPSYSAHTPLSRGQATEGRLHHVCSYRLPLRPHSGPLNTGPPGLRASRRAAWSPAAEDRSQLELQCVGTPSPVPTLLPPVQPVALGQPCAQSRKESQPLRHKKFTSETPTDT